MQTHTSLNLSFQPGAACAVEKTTNLSRIVALAQQVKAGAVDHYYAEALARPDIDVLVYSENGVDVGWCLLNWNAKYPLYARLGAPEIQDLNVLESHRRKGIATTLIQSCEAKAKSKNCSHIGISFGLTANYGAAQRLYFKLGFEPDGAGAMYDRVPVALNAQVKADDDLTLMLIKPLTAV